MADRAGDYVSVGTPLAVSADQLAFDARRGKQASYVPVWKQEVTDDQGRKRLHGAFKGGFSAGYFNTVGSKEGWMPGTFSSSRTTRAERKAMRPEDFMDEEDLEDAMDGKQLQAIGQAPSPTLLPGTSDANDLTSLFAVPATRPDSIGDRLARKLGYPSLLPTRQLDPWYLAPKTDRRGLGAAPAGYSATPCDDPPVTKRLRTGPGPSSGIGVGVLNEDDDPDEEVDVFDDGAAIRSEMAAVLEGKGRGSDHERMLRKRLHQQQRTRMLALPAAATPVPRTAGYDRCTDGRAPLDGFILQERGAVLGSMFVPPPVPLGWKPNPPILRLDRTGAPPPPVPSFPHRLAPSAPPTTVAPIPPPPPRPPSPLPAAVPPPAPPPAFPSLLASKFTSSHVQVGEAQEVRVQPVEDSRTTAEQAAAMGQFGQLTRSVHTFYPTRLLCKRFGVQNPHPTGAPASEGPATTMAESRADAPVDELLSDATMREMLAQSGWGSGMLQPPRSQPPPQARDEDAAMDPLAVGMRPPQEVFDLIFGAAVAARVGQVAAGDEDAPVIVGDAVVDEDGAGIEDAARVRLRMAQARDAEYKRIDERDVEVVCDCKCGTACGPSRDQVSAATRGARRGRRCRDSTHHRRERRRRRQQQRQEAQTDTGGAVVWRRG
ncbi:hypothetical protein AMAG_04719 [Allomyces macrogynus ATCC 38327]|uniref:G patch domain-containing protein n=1 Tax=Allomyces macrogynus (strain ATCC 38327) TaxID=578462 RepID=A0A0L0S689_ALLM3|nr:hypothetical protein AMAG_04719 [Allomyces macrogynus ATCC 38327]|eukprot:KNE57874.1 hypothetical protein AMAG_04719 [Allomyces macrogynus ATCC 38327]